MNKLKRILVFAAGPLLAIGMAGCDSGGTTTTQATPTLIVEQPTPTQARVEEPTQEVGITPRIMQPTQTPSASSQPGTDAGTTVMVNKSGVDGNVRVTVNSMRRWEGDADNQPEAGNEYLILDITVENIGSKEQAFLLSETSLEDSDKKRYRGVDIPTPKRRPSGVLPAGETKNGEWPLEVPKSATGLIMVLDAADRDRVEIKLDE